MSDEVRYEVDGRVARIALNRPERRNALSRSVMAELVDCFLDADENDDVRVVALTGTGDRAFCAGADLKEMDENARGSRAIGIPMTGPARNLHEVVLEVGKPTVAALNGPALAGGCELALACDLRIAAEHAHLGVPEAKRGMGANFATVLLPRLVPRAIALEMLYTGDPVSAEQARHWGLVNAVVPGDELKSATEELLAAIADNAPLSLRRCKAMANKGWERPVHDALRLDAGPNPYRSADREEGVRAFVEKRAPRWTGR